MEYVCRMVIQRSASSVIRLNMERHISLTPASMAMFLCIEVIQRKKVAVISAVAILVVVAILGYMHIRGGRGSGCYDVLAYDGAFREVKSSELGFRVHCGSGIAQGDLPVYVWVKLRDTMSGVKMIYGGCGVWLSNNGISLCIYDASGRMMKCSAVIEVSSPSYTMTIRPTPDGICVMYDRYERCIKCTLSADFGTVYINNACFSGYVCFV